VISYAGFKIGGNFNKTRAVKALTVIYGDNKIIRRRLS
jgi:hypothetical protein